MANAQAVNQWGNITIPVGPTAAGWSETGNPSWQNITSLTLQLNYPQNTDISLRIGALFFRGEYIQPLITNATQFIYVFVLQFSLQFLATWLILTGMIFLALQSIQSHRSLETHLRRSRFNHDHFGYPHGNHHGSNRNHTNTLLPS